VRMVMAPQRQSVGEVRAAPRCAGIPPTVYVATLARAWEKYVPRRVVRGFPPPSGDGGYGDGGYVATLARAWGKYVPRCVVRGFPPPSGDGGYGGGGYALGEVPAWSAGAGRGCSTMR
jgi:hypothetical protein